MKYLKQLDFFGKNIMFEDNFSSFYKTILGSLMSFILIVSVSSIGFIFGREIFLREVPIVMNSKEILTDSFISINEIPMFFLLSTKIGEPIMNVTSYFDLVVKHLYINSKYEYITESILLTEQCDVNSFINFPIMKNAFDQTKLYGFQLYCPDYNQNITIRNTLESNVFSVIRIEVNKCSEELRNSGIYNNDISKASKCAKEIPDHVFGSVTIAMYDSFFDPKNYTNPLKSFSKGIMNSIGKTLAKNIYIEISKNLLISDVGWIIENREIQNANFISVTKEDVYVPTSNEVFAFNIGSPKFRENTLRSYMKVQELFAKIGGLFNAFSIIVKVLLYNYVNFKFRYFYSKFLFELVDDKGKDVYSNCKLKNDNNAQLIFNNLNSSEEGHKVENKKNSNKSLNKNSQNDNKLNCSPLEKENDKVEETEKFSKIKKSEISSYNQIKSNNNFLIKDNQVLLKKIDNLQKTEEMTIEDLSYLSYIRYNYLCCKTKKKNLSMVKLISPSVSYKFSFENYLFTIKNLEINKILI